MARPRLTASKNASDRTLVPVLAVRDVVHFPGGVDSLLVARDASLNALRVAQQGDRRVIAISQRDMSQEDPGPNDLYRVGTIGRLLQALPLPDGTMRGTIKGLDRAK